MFSGTVAFHTLGCKLNFSETSTIARHFQEKGYQKVPFSEKADVYVINTCSVTENADRECRSIVRGALQQNPDAFIAVVGCYAQLKPYEIAAIEGVDVVLGATEKFRLLNYIQLSRKNTYALVKNCEISEAGEFTSSYSSGDRTRSFLKVQDGRDYSCTFCTIPLARGKSRSDSVGNVVNNARQLGESGVKEIVLTGVNIGDFGYGQQVQAGQRKRRESDFFALIRELDQVEAVPRFRISSIEPNLLEDRIIDLVAGSQRFMPHFHIPLQSGSNEILGLMKRRYRRELFAARVSRIKEAIPHCCIGVDVITGFPGETEKHFMETYDFLKDLEISYLHVFTYSERENTPAAEMEGIVPVDVRKQRTRMLRVLSAKKLSAFYQQQVGTTRPVLFEQGEKNGYLFGHTDNYVRVRAPYDDTLRNTIIGMTLNGIEEDASVACSFPEKAAVSV